MVWTMLKRAPGLLGGGSVLDEHGQLWAEFREYEQQESEAEHRRAQRRQAEARRPRHRRGGRRGR